MPTPTDNHGYDVYEVGEDGPWTHGPTIEQLDTDVEIRDTDANKSNYEAKQDALFLATDTGRRYVGDGTNWNELTYPVAGDGSLTTPDTVINVPGDEPTVDAALSRIDSEYYPAGHSVDINIQTGHELQTNVSKSQVDYRHVEITSEDDVVGVADGFPSDRHIFRFSKSSVAPLFDIMVDGQHDGAKHPNRAFQIWEGSLITFTPFNERTDSNGNLTRDVGAMNADIGLSVMLGSKVVAFGGRFSDNIRRGASISNGSWAYLQEAILTNNDNHASGTDGFALRCGESYAQVHFADMKNNHHGIHANQSSLVGANGVDVSNCADGIYAVNNTTVNAANATVNNCTAPGVLVVAGTVVLSDATSDGCPKFVYAYEGSTIAANGATVSNTTDDGYHIADASTAHISGSISNAGDNGVLSANGATCFVDGTITGSSTDDVSITDGGTVAFDSGMMTTNSTAEPHQADVSHSFNTVHGAGILFAENFETA